VPAQASDFVSGMPTYWGDQPIVSCAYRRCGFLWEFFSLFIDERKIKYVFLTGAITALMLSGVKIPILTDFFIDYIPMYNKFRAVSSIQVILELCFSCFGHYGITILF
jgi:hypothetical protein